MEQIHKSLKKCNAPWCLMVAAEGSESCVLHNQMPVIVTRGEDGKFTYIESADDWKRRFNRARRAAENAAKKQAESDAKMAKR